MAALAKRAANATFIFNCASQPASLIFNSTWAWAKHRPDSSRPKPTGHTARHKVVATQSRFTPTTVRLARPPAVCVANMIRSTIRHQQPQSSLTDALALHNGMSDLTISASNVSTNSTVNSGSIKNYTSNITGNAGQVVYIDSNDLIELAKADTAIHAAASGILLNSVYAGQPGAVQSSGSVNIGTGTVGQVYCVSAATSGNACPQSDLTTGNYVFQLGVVSATGVLSLFANQPAPFVHA